MHEKNIILSKQIDELIKEQKKIEKQMDKVTRNTTISEIKIEPNIYLKGMFDRFDKEFNALVIFIEGKEYFYSLDCYQCKYLPMSNSRVFIFKSDKEEILIYGFRISKMIEPANKITAQIKAIVKNQNKLKLYNSDIGYIETIVSDNFFNKILLQLGDYILLKQIYIDGDYYYNILDELTEVTSNRNEVLKLLLKGRIKE